MLRLVREHYGMRGRRARKSDASMVQRSGYDVGRKRPWRMVGSLSGDGVEFGQISESSLLSVALFS